MPDDAARPRSTPQHAGRGFAPHPAARAALLCGLAGVGAVLARDEFRLLPDALATRGLAVVPDSVRWIDPPGLGGRRALLIARRGDAPADLYVVTARTGPGDRVLRVEDVSDLTRSPDADEVQLVVDEQERFAAFATRVRGEFVAFTVVDAGARPLGVDAGEQGDWQGRVREAVTRWQQTGRPEGYGVVRFDLRRPVRTLDLAFRDGALEALAGEHDHGRDHDSDLVRVDPATGGVLAGEPLVRERPRRDAPPDNWVTWAVDSVRALPFVGTVPIAWAESVAFRARNAAVQARNAAAGGHDTARDVAEDLADVLAVRGAGASSASSVEGPVVAWPPAPVRAVLSPAIAGEGEWSALSESGDPYVRGNAGAPPGMYITFVRSDPGRVDSRAYVLVWDPRQIEIHVAPGSQEPMGATGETGTGAIPRDEDTMARVVAGFNGGFQSLHGEYGVYAEGSLLIPPKPYAATVALRADGSTAFGSWPADRNTIPSDVVEFRQNLTAVIDRGEFNPWGREDWGAILYSPIDLRTIRTALCLTQEGYVEFFWGADLSPRSLGDAMRAARCTYGVHLDMNGINTGFELYKVFRTGSEPALTEHPRGGFAAEGPMEEMPGLTFRARRLVRGMQHTVPRYLHRNPRDFFYLLLRPVLPGPALNPPVRPPAPGEGSWHVAGLGDTPFPWPMARTRVRPDPARPERWVNLLRVDARRVRVVAAGAGAGGSSGLVARWMVAGGSAGAVRVGITESVAGAQWAVSPEVDGVAGEALRPGMASARGACVDARGFLVFAVADRAEPDLLWRALDLAGCAEEGRVSLPGVTLALPSGESAAGDAVPAGARAVFDLVPREFPLATNMFPEVTPVGPEVWRPVQERRVRYFRTDNSNCYVTVRLAGDRAVVQRLPGVSTQFCPVGH